MADSILSIIIRDTEHLCAPYQKKYSFFVSIYTCDLKPLHWKGITYDKFPLNVKGQGGGLIHAQVKVPPGCYLVRAISYEPCDNVVSDWAWVELGCDETVCVNLVIPRVIDCLYLAELGLRRGTIVAEFSPQKEIKVNRLMPEEVESAREILNKIIDMLKEKKVKSAFPPPPSDDEIDKLKEKLARM